MSVRRLGIGGSVLVLWVVLLGVVAFPALAVAPEAPEVSVESVKATEAMFHGVISPKVATFPVEPGTYQFVYRPSTTNECQGAGQILAPASPNVYFGLEVESVFEPVAALAAHTEYAVCVIAETIGGKTISAPVTFTTALPPETPVTEAAEKVTGTRVTLRGELDPGSTAKNGYYFAYSTNGECTAGGTSEPGSELTATKRKVSTSVSGLEPLREYTVCLVATNSAGETAVGNAVKFSTPAAPPAVEGESVSNVKAGEAHLEGIVNPNNEATECKFQYEAEEPLLTTPTIVSCEPASFAGIFGGQPVGVTVGLEARTRYYYRIVATNATGTNEGTIEHFTTSTPPEVPTTTEPAAAITATSATLEGVLNPGGEGEAGSYEFVYRQSATECQKTNPETGQSENENATSATTVPAGKTAVTAAVEGLAPGARYTFCLLSRNEAGETALGNAVSFTTHAVAPSVAEEFADEVSSGSATLHAGVNPGGASTTFRFEYGPTMSYGQTVTGEAGAGHETVVVQAHPQDLTPDVLYHYRVVATNSAGPSGGVSGPDRIFTTQPVASSGLLPDGRQWELVSPPDKHGAEVESKLVYLGGLMQGAENGDAVTYITNAPVTANSQSNPLENQVLSRRGPGGWSSQDIATPHAGSSAREFVTSGANNIRINEAAEYWAFSPNLSLAYAEPESTTPLAPPAPAPKRVLAQGNAYNSGYVRDSSTGKYSITNLNSEEWYDEQAALIQPPPTCDASTSPAGGAIGQEGVRAVSRDGCYVYFNSGRGAGPLEVAHDDGTRWSTTLISSLAGAGALSWGPGGFTELSPDGRYLTFMSDQSLTGYDNTDANSPVGEPRADEEVFLYDAAENTLTCPSCDPTGARPVGRFDEARNGVSGPSKLQVDSEGSWVGHWLGGILPPWPRSVQVGAFNADPAFIHQPRYLTDSGELFFESPLALVPEDVNGTWDVYEYRPPGVGSCTKAAGCVALISSGQSSAESVLIEASTDGSDVFFFTSDRLAPEDVDNAYDVYDAHVCSVAVPCPPLPLPPAPACEGDACQQSVAPPDSPTPASLTYNGPGSVVIPAAVAKPRAKATQCKHGFVKKKSKCVKTRAKKSRKTSRRGK